MNTKDHEKIISTELTEIWRKSHIAIASQVAKVDVVNA